MMKKAFLPIVFLEILTLVAAIVLVTYTYIQFTMSKAPYGMSSNLTVFSITQDYSSANFLPMDRERITTIISRIKKIAVNAEITIINSNISNMGLGVFDSRNKYKSPDNANFLFSDPNSNFVLLKSGSFYDGMKNFATLSGVNMTVAGTYDDSYILFSKEFEYIFNLFSDPSLDGIFYIESTDQNVVHEIINVLEQENYKISYHNYALNFSQLILFYLSKPLYVVTLIGFLLININLCLFYVSYFNNFKKRMRIHLIYGARNKSLIASYTCMFIVYTVPLNIAICILCYVIFKNSIIFLPVPGYAAVLIGSSFLNILLFFFIFVTKLHCNTKDI